jgi:hypothetical protein
MSALTSAPLRAVLGLAMAAAMVVAGVAVDDAPADAEGGTAAVQDAPALAPDIVRGSDLTSDEFGALLQRIGKDHCDQTHAALVCQTLVYADPGDTSPTWTAAVWAYGSGLARDQIVTSIEVDGGARTTYPWNFSQGRYVMLTADSLPSGEGLEFALDFEIGGGSDGLDHEYEFDSRFVPRDGGTYAWYPGYQTWS